MDKVKKIVEPALTVATGALAEPVAGWAGILSGGDAGAVERTRDALTYQPRSEPGRQGLRALASAMGPVTETMKGVETTLGDAGYRAGGPGLAAAMATVPTAVGTWAGGRLLPALKNAPKAGPRGPVNRQAGYITPIDGSGKVGTPVVDSPMVPRDISQLVPNGRATTVYDALKQVHGNAESPVTRSLRASNDMGFLERPVSMMNDPAEARMFVGDRNGLRVNVAAQNARTPADLNQSRVPEFIDALNESYGQSKGAPRLTRLEAGLKAQNAAAEARNRR